MKKENIYYSGLFLLCLKNWIYISKVFSIENILEKLLNIIIIFIFVFCIFNKKYTKKEIIIIGTVGIVLLINSLCINEYIFFLDFLAIAASKKIEINNIVKFMFKFNIVMLSIHVLITSVSILFNVNSDIYITITDGISRLNFCMRHANYAAAVIFWILAMYIFLKNKKELMNKIILICVTGIISYIFTKSRTSLITYIVYLLLIIVNENEKLKRYIVFISKYLFAILSILLSILIINFFNVNSNVYEILLKLNDILSYRLVLGVVGYYNYGWTFFGQVINYLIPVNANGFYIDELVVDSFYVSCLMNYGVVLLIIFTLGFYKISKKLDSRYLIYIILVIIISISERYIPYMAVCFPLIFFKSAIFGEKYNNIEKI